MNIDENVLRTAVASAVVSQLNEKAVSDLVVQAVTKLLEPEPPSSCNYGRKTLSPLESIFRDEVQKIAQVEVKRLFEDPQRIQQIRDVVIAGWEKFIADPNHLAIQVSKMLNSLMYKD